MALNGSLQDLEKQVMMETADGNTAKRVSVNESALPDGAATEATLQSEFDETQALLTSEFNETQALIFSESNETQTLLTSEFNETQNILQTEFDDTQTILQSEFDATQSLLQSEFDQTQTILQTEFDDTQTLLQSEFDSTQTLLQAEFDETQSILSDIESGVPESLGQKTMAESMPVVIASDQSPVYTKPVNGTLTDFSGTATSTSTQILAANSTRKFILIQNIGNQSIWINFGGAATVGSGSIEISGGATLILDGSFMPTEAIFAIRGGLVNVAFTGKEGN